MIAATPGTLIVGCSAASAMQVYVADCANRHGLPGIVYVAGRKKPTPSTKYAMTAGVDVRPVSPGYLTTVRARARAEALRIGGCVGWSESTAKEDTAAQCANIPDDVKRIVVPTGSGATLKGIVDGMKRLGRSVPILAVAVSGMYEDVDGVEAIHLTRDYDDEEAAILPDGSYLDPYYAAKALKFVRPGDCLWVSGRRSILAIKKITRTKIELLRKNPTLGRWRDSKCTTLLSGAQQRADNRSGAEPLLDGSANTCGHHIEGLG
ncbi:MAG TPA: hypothetical protein VMT61_08915 [Candidatus Binataceae bacterium]|nr:hypothetical protein [Candidatus Binataceae bacterium]